MYKLLPILLALVLGGCELVLPTDPIEEEADLCELFITLEVVRSGNTYWTNELDIFDNQLGLECRRVSLREEWIQVAEGVIWLFVYETWDCYTCTEGQVLPDA